MGGCWRGGVGESLEGGWKGEGEGEVARWGIGDG